MKSNLFSCTPLALCAALLAALGGCSESDESGLGGQAAGLVVVNSDYTSTSISLVDPDTPGLATDDCINSGTVAPGLSLALSGDVVLASEPQPDAELVLVDRNNSALTWLDPATCVVARQLSVATGFYANPHDVIGLSARKAYVTRYESNPTPTPAPGDFDEGEDVLIVDPAAGAILGRIALGSYATTSAGGTILARPDRMVTGEGNVYVALGNISQDFGASGDGRIVVIDTDSDAVTGTIDIPGRRGCNGMRYVRSARRLLVACAGAFSDGAAQVDGSAIVAIDVAADPPVIVDELPASTFGGLSLSAAGFAAIDGTRGLVVTFGSIDADPPDALWHYDLVAGTAEKITDAEEGFVLGEIVVEDGRAFVTDATANAPLLRVYDVSSTPVRIGSFATNPARGLQPRSVARY